MGIGPGWDAGPVHVRRGELRPLYDHLEHVELAGPRRDGKAVYEDQVSPRLRHREADLFGGGRPRGRGDEGIARAGPSVEVQVEVHALQVRFADRDVDQARARGIEGLGVDAPADDRQVRLEDRRGYAEAADREPGQGEGGIRVERSLPGRVG